MNTNQIKNSLLLLLTACIWGVAFVAQSVGMDYVEPFTFNCVRSIIGGLVLIPCIWFLDYLSKKEKRGEKSAEKLRTEQKTLLTGGICCGIVLFLASNFQQFGVKYTTVGKAGFITACYIVIVPLLGLFFKKRCSPLIWLSVALALTGLYLLCITESFHIGTGDILVFICAVLFSIHILVIDYFSPKVDGVRMSCIQFFVCGILSGAAMLLTETPNLTDILAAWQPILYAGVMSCGVAYTLQIIGQKDMNPTIASLILSLESCISVLAGWMILGQTMSIREFLGCVVMFAAIILAQLPTPSFLTEKHRASA